MDDAVQEIARAAAERLQPRLGAEVLVGTEEALRSGGDDTTPRRFLDPLSVGSFIVSVASLAWAIYSDTRTQRAEPSSDVVARRVRLQLGASTLDAAARDLIVDVVVDETVATARVRQSEG